MTDDPRDDIRHDLRDIVAVMEHDDLPAPDNLSWHPQGFTLKLGGEAALEKWLLALYQVDLDLHDTEWQRREVEGILDLGGRPGPRIRMVSSTAAKRRLTVVGGAS